MSSTYEALCLSHEPAISAASGDFAALIDLIRAKEVRGHPDCDLIIGRFSYPLIEVTCPGQATCSHRDAITIDVQWVRLLFAAREAGIGDSLDLGCWTARRIGGLRSMLGFGIAQEKSPWPST